ncbi:MAG: phosphotransferase [Nitrospinaceae bacterium]
MKSNLLKEIETGSTSFSTRREILSAITSKQDTVASIRQAGDPLKGWSPDREWVRIFERFDTGLNPYCTLVYETKDDPQRLCLLEVYESQPTQLGSHQLSIAHEVAGWFLLTPFQNDPQLPTLPEVLKKTTAARVVRYRPHKRCTMRCQPTGREEFCFVKIFPDAQGKTIHEESLDLWRASEKGDLNFAVARPGHWDEETNSLWQGEIPGTSIADRLFSGKDMDLAYRVGCAAGSIPASKLAPKDVFDETEQLRRTERYAKELGWRISKLQPDIASFMEQLKNLHGRAGLKSVRPLHGSPHVHQWLDNGSQLGLVDFDRISMGHPELDAATFVAEIDYEDPTTVRIDELNQSFLEGYQTKAGALNFDLFQAYRAHKHLAKALKASRAVRVDAEKRAERNLGRAIECLRRALP